MLLVATLAANKETEIANMNPKIGRIGPGITQTDKEEDITIGIMITQANVVEVGDVITTIIRDSKTITGQRPWLKSTPQLQSTRSIVSTVWVTIASIPNPHNIMINDPDQCNPNKQPIYANYVTIKDILTINVNLQVILWLELSKPLTKAENTTTKMDKVNGHKEIMTMKILMTSFVSREGSRCH